MTERAARADAIIGRYRTWTAAAGLIPAPLLDMAAVTALQLKMIAALAEVYQTPFSRERARSIVGALTAAVAPPMLAGTLFGMLGPAFKMMPGIGTVVGVVTTPLLNVASTHALGRVFVQHFESGGTLLDMNPDGLREHYRQELDGVNRGGGSERAAGPADGPRQAAGRADE